MHKLIFIHIMGLSLLASCSKTGNETKLPDGVGINVSYMDTTVNPADDFFGFVNGGWVAKTEIPSDQGRWGSFGELRENTLLNVLSVLKEAADNNQYTDESDQGKAADFFAVGMDSTLAENQGFQPIQPYLQKIEGIRSTLDVQKYLAEQQRIVGGAFFGLFVNTDLKKSNEVALYLSAGGLGLPERDYYTKTDDKSKETREKYTGHVARMLSLTGVDESKAKSQASAIMAIETELTNGTMTKEERRDPDKRYNKRALSQLSQMVPSVQWSTYLSDLGIQGIDSVIVNDLGFMSAFESVLSRKKLDDIKAYLRWRLIDRTAPVLHYETVKANFEFNSQYLQGVDQLRPRWKRVLDATNGALGEAIGKLYVDKHFPPEAKQKALQMVENIKLAFADRIKNLDWMSDSTKEKALKKLGTFTVKIGYPEEWRDYSNLIVEKSPEKASFAVMF